MSWDGCLVSLVNPFLVSVTQCVVGTFSLTILKDSQNPKPISTIHYSFKCHNELDKETKYKLKYLNENDDVSRFRP